MTHIISVSCSDEHKNALKRHHLSPSDCFHYGILLKCNEQFDFTMGQHLLYLKIESLAKQLTLKEEKIKYLENNKNYTMV